MAERYHHGDLRGALVAALRPLVERDGPQGFSIAEAARAAGVSSGAPYRHFKDRDAVLAALSRDLTDRMGARMIERGEGLAGAPRLVALCRAYVDVAREEPGLFRLSFGAAAPAEDAEDAAAGRAVFDLAVSAVADTLSLPARSPKVRGAAFGLWCSVHGLAFIVAEGKAAEIGLEADIDGTLREAVRRWLL